MTKYYTVERLVPIEGEAPFGIFATESDAENWALHKSALEGVPTEETAFRVVEQLLP